MTYLAPAHIRVVATASNVAMSSSALEYVASSVIVFPTLTSMVEEEERIRVLAGLGIISKLAQVLTCSQDYLSLSLIHVNIENLQRPVHV